LKLIAVHEVVHASGLLNSDHNKEDLFQASPSSTTAFKAPRTGEGVARRKCLDAAGLSGRHNGAGYCGQLVLIHRL
jgi:hypothetical protein